MAEMSVGSSAGRGMSLEIDTSESTTITRTFESSDLKTKELIIAIHTYYILKSKGIL